MRHSFTFEPAIAGIPVACIEGEVTVEASGDGWRFAGITVDGMALNPAFATDPKAPRFQRVEIDVPETHYLYRPIMLFLTSREMMLAIDYAWERRAAPVRELERV